MYDFAKEMYFDVRAPGCKLFREKTAIKLLKSQGSMVSASTCSNTKFLPADPVELWNRLKVLMQDGNNSVEINDEIIVTFDKFLEYKCISKKQHKQF